MTNRQVIVTSVSVAFGVMIALLALLLPHWYGNWATGASLPTPRLSASSTSLPVHDGNIYIIGGAYDNNADFRAHDMAIYNIVGNSYSAGADYPAVGIAGSAQVVFDAKIYTFGGVRQKTEDYTNWLRIYDIASDSWGNGTDVPWVAEGMFATLDPDTNLIYVGGGCGMPMGVYDEWYTYDPATDAWTQKTDLPTPRGNGVIAYYNGAIYISAGGGGLVDPGNTLLDTTWRYNIASDTWTTGLDTLPTKVVLPAFALHQASGRIYLFGGRTSATHTYTNEVQVYDIAADSWLTAGGDRKFLEVPAGYGFAQGAFVGSTFYMFGGWDGVTALTALYEDDVNVVTYESI